MSSAAEQTAALANLRTSYDAGRLAHAYIITGPPKAAAKLLVEEFLAGMFGGEGGRNERTEDVCRRMLARNHPDVVWMEPQSKSRAIRADEVRQTCQLVARTSYEGGWKAVLVLNADRMTPEAANIFLKTLEEPPPRSILFLFTDAPQNLLPTVVSRCQRLTLSGEADVLPAEWRDTVLDILAGNAGAGIWDAVSYAGQMKALLDEVKGVAEKDVTRAGEELTKEVREARIAARVQEAKAGVLRLVLLWRRDVMLASAGIGDEHFHFRGHAAAICAQAAGTSLGLTLRRVDDVERMVARMDRHLPPASVFCEDQVDALLRRHT